MADAFNPKSSAQALLAKVPRELNCGVWLEQHEALIHHLLHMMARALSTQTGYAADGVLQPIAKAYTALRGHAKQLLGDAVPVVLAADGRHEIPFEKLSEARAKVAVLQAELQAAHIAGAQARDLLALAQSCMAQGIAPPADLMTSIEHALVNKSGAMPAADAGELQAAVESLVNRHSDQAFSVSRLREEMGSSSKRQESGGLSS